MKKKFTEVLAIVLAMATILSGCGGGGASNGESASSAPMGTTGVEETVESNEPLPTEEPTEEPVVDPKTVITRSDSFTITRQDMGARNAFSEDGVAWLIVEDPETHHQYNAVVNTNGEIVYLSDPQDFGYGAKQANEISTTAFYNGLSAIYLYANFAIVNANGEEVYKNTDEDMLLCGGFEDGSFLLAKHETGFDHDYWELYVLDSDLNLRDTTIQLDDEPENENASELIADGVYLCGSYPTEIYYTKEGISRKIDGTYEGQDSDNIYFSDPNGCYAVAKAPLLDPTVQLNETPYGTISLVKSNTYHLQDEYYNEITYDEIMIALGRIKPVSYPTFSEGVETFKIDDYCGGYSAIYLKGVDENYYATIIDEKGEMQYEPKQLKHWLYWGAANNKDNSISCYGYIFNRSHDAFDDEGLMIIAPDGAEKKLGQDDLTGLEDKSFVYQGSTLKLAIGNGFILTGDGSMAYYSTDGTKEIDTFTANYNSDGNLIYTDQNGEKHVSGAAHEGESDGSASSDGTQMEHTSKNYISVDDFSIEGKWKNVGETTWGQAQTGAIIVFDGKNCNYFSPNDTYAFYKDGDNYKLDCTSPLGDTISSTVKIVDDNNIDIYSGSTVIELTRVG